eukprot:1697710-Prymnesium_polylepis.2
MLMCAPTGAGKTNVAMLTIMHEIGMHIDKKTHEHAHRRTFTADSNSRVPCGAASQPLAQQRGQHIGPNRTPHECASRPAAAGGATSLIGTPLS